MQRTRIAREVYHIIRSNLPSSIGESITLSQLVAISRAIENKLFKGAASPSAYLDLSTLKLRIAALACAVLIHSEEGDGSGHRSDTCTQLLAAARSSLPHCAMVLISYESRQFRRQFSKKSASDASAT